MARFLVDTAHRGSGQVWAVVLAGGEGSRLSSLTTLRPGVTVPKQFCSLRGGRSLLEEAIERAQTVAAPERVCAVVSAHHRHWWDGPLADLAGVNIIEQPCSRGTANGMLYPLLHIAERDPQARVVILPSDHHFRSEQTVRRALSRSLDAVENAGIVLLGLDPEDADPELGYIVPGEGEASELCAVRKFVEKPSRQEARALIARGALWNVFICAARIDALLAMFARRCPDALMAMRELVQRKLYGAQPSAAHAELYEQLPELDFSRHVAQMESAALRVLRVPKCGWSDLGTPRRVAEVLERQAGARVARPSRPFVAHLSLAEQHARVGAEL